MALATDRSLLLQIGLVPSFSLELQRLITARLPFSKANEAGRVNAVFFAGDLYSNMQAEVSRCAGGGIVPGRADSLPCITLQLDKYNTSCRLEMARGFKALAERKKEKVIFNLATSSPQQ